MERFNFLFSDIQTTGSISAFSFFFFCLTRLAILHQDPSSILHLVAKTLDQQDSSIPGGEGGWSVLLCDKMMMSLRLQIVSDANIRRLSQALVERRVTSDAGWALFPGVGVFLDAHRCYGHPGHLWSEQQIHWPKLFSPTSNRHFELRPPTPGLIIHTGLPPVWPGLWFLFISDLRCDSFPSHHGASHCYFRRTKAGSTPA